MPDYFRILVYCTCIDLRDDFHSRARHAPTAAASSYSTSARCGVTDTADTRGPHAGLRVLSSGTLSYYLRYKVGIGKGGF